MKRLLLTFILVPTLALAAPKHSKAELDQAATAVQPLVASKDVAKVGAALDEKLGPPDKVLKGSGVASWYAKSGRSCFELRFAFGGGPMSLKVVETFSDACK